MQGENKKIDDFNLDSFDMDVDLENPFAGEAKPTGAPAQPQGKQSPRPGPRFEERLGEEHKRRSSKDFNPDMDALLLTAQSSMIIEGMQLYTQGNFASTTLQVFMEALKGISLYIKILDRNPNNYNKLKALIDADLDCKEVEKIAFNLYHKVYNAFPQTDQEKLNAFEKFESIFAEAVNKASISNSMKILKKYMLLSGSVDEVKLKECAARQSGEFLSDVNNFIQHLQMADDLLKKGKGEIAKGLKGRDLNIFIIKTSYLLYYYFNLIGNAQAANHYGRMHTNYRKYFIIRE